MGNSLGKIIFSLALLALATSGCSGDDDPNVTLNDPLVHAFDVTRRLENNLLSRSWCSPYERSGRGIEVVNFFSGGKLFQKLGRRPYSQRTRLSWDIDSRRTSSEVVIQRDDGKQIANVNVHYDTRTGVVGYLEYQSLVRARRLIQLTPCYAYEKFNSLKALPLGASDDRQIFEYLVSNNWSKASCRGGSLAAHYFMNRDGYFMWKSHPSAATSEYISDFILKPGGLIYSDSKFEENIHIAGATVDLRCLNLRYDGRVNRLRLVACNPKKPGEFLVYKAGYSSERNQRKNTLACNY